MDSFNEFRNKGKKIRIQPKPASWRKLEQRLDARRRYAQRGLSSRSTAMAAALALLVVTSMLLVFQVQKTVSTNSADAAWEEMATTDSPTLPKPNIQQVKSIPEGQVFKQLVNKAEPLEGVDLGWLEGEWQPTSGRTQLVESWQADHNGQWIQQILLEGSVQHEDMIIQQASNGRLQLKVRLAAGSNLVAFDLEQQTTSQLLFTNSELDFPKRIAFRRLGPNNISIVLYNPDPMGLSAEQVTFLQQYNTFQPQMVRRDLERVSEMY